MAKREQIQNEEKKYTREALMRDARFSSIQRDFLRIILKKPFYTIAEAEEAVSNFFRKD